MKGLKKALFGFFAQKVFEYVAVKAEIAETLVSAYKANDKATLIHISDDLVPSVAELISDIRILHRNLLRKLCTTITFGALDCRYGGIIARLKYAIRTISKYVNNEINAIQELYFIFAGFPILSIIFPCQLPLFVNV